MSNPTFSIITVCLNAEHTIYDTLVSVIKQTCSDYELIVKDGMSLDGTTKVVEALKEENTCIKCFVSKDKGIYDAMNQALVLAKGKYVLFLNAGDKLCDAKVLERVKRNIANEDVDIWYGDVIEITGEKNYYRKYTSKNIRLWYYALGACLCHQTMFCKRSLFENKIFDLSFRICADRDWQLSLIKEGAYVKPLGFCVSVVDTEGFSKSHVSALEQEIKICVDRYCGRWRIFYSVIDILKRNSLIRKVISEIERIVSKGRK